MLFESISDSRVQTHSRQKPRQDVGCYITLCGGSKFALNFNWTSHSIINSRLPVSLPSCCLLGFCSFVCLSVTFVSVSACAKLLLPRLSFDILFFPSFLLSPQSHYLSLFPVLPSHWWYVCQLPPVLEHLSPTSPPSIYLDAIFMRSGSHPALLSGCTWTLLTNCLFFSCASALFSSSSLLLLPPGCTAGKQCFPSFFLHCAFL